MIVKNSAIDSFFQMMVAVLDLPANQHSQSSPVLLQEDRIGYVD